MKSDLLHEIICKAAERHAIDTSDDHEVGDLQDALSDAMNMLTEEQLRVLHAKRLEQIDCGNGAVDHCECDNTHQQNDTVCMWCWNRGRRKWNDPEVCEGCDGSGIRPWSNMQLPAGHAGPPPEGFVIVERCDTCDKFKDDLAAAQAWGDEARWQEGNGTSQAIAKPRTQGNVLTCVYCGQEYPKGTPAAKHQALFDHIRQCPKHPLSKATAILDAMTTSIGIWRDHYEARDDSVTAAEDGGQADAYGHVATTLSMIAQKVKDGDMDGALADAKEFGTDCPEKEMSCAECGGAMRIDGAGVSNHVTDLGEIDHDADADHTAVNGDEYGNT